MKIKNFVAAAVLASAALVSTGALAQNSANVSANSSVTLLRPIAISKTTDLLFGRIVKPATGTGTVSIANNSNTVVAGSGAVALASTTSRAVFAITGEGAQAIDITVGALTLNGPNSSTLTVTLTPDLASGAVLSGTLASAGALTLNVGGSFDVPALQDTGLYTGSFTVTVAYQ